MTDKGMKKALRLVLQVLINAVIILVLIRVFMYAYDFSYQVFTDNCLNPMNKSEVQFEIPPDSTTMEIVDALVEDGLVADRYVMLAKVYLSSYHGKMMPGIYTLSPSMTQDEILKTITGTAVEEEEE
ncbi:MAG: hypothetical protein NC089_04305 [Bacteroides sp.]|nr:hypothetical protein [Bacteroides sp.]MCM1548616.1 hypothetical protein [Clostridium sp.]